MKRLSAKQVLCLIKKLGQITSNFTQPASDQIVLEYGQDPFLILASCILSLRTQDKVSLPASRRLFVRAKTPQEIVRISQQDLEQLIYPVGFYRRKAQQLQELSKKLIECFQGRVPHTEEALLSLPGVGIKTAALVLSVGLNIPALCVDTHVHRISNLWKIVSTKTPAQTEKALQKIIPKQYWILYSRLLVTLGQNMRGKNKERLLSSLFDSSRSTS